jgi:hypothetical protein
VSELKGHPAPQAALPERTRILVDEDAAQEVGHTAGLRFVGFAPLKGFTGLHGLYEVTWQAGTQPPRPDDAAGKARPQGRAAGCQGGMP